MSSVSRTSPENATSFIILGADAVLAAQPASPVQLAHACQALGFELAAPATWGDELIAERCIDELTEYEHPAAVICTCPLVTERLTRTGAVLEPFMLTFVSPPVATARYLRAAFAGRALHITYAGACPGADDESIDARITPAELLDAFAIHDIDLAAQPSCFDASLPLDRRRFFSLPGGVPARAQVEHLAQRALVELSGDDAVLELAQQLMEQSPALIDIAAPLGCACAGASHGVRGHSGAGLLTLEPPRARQRVIDASLHVEVSQTLEQACRLQLIAEEPSALEVHLAADAAPPRDEPEPAYAPEDIAPAVAAVSVAAVSVEAVTIDADIAQPAELPALADSSAFKRRPVSVRSAAPLPSYTTDSGEVVPRASLAVLRRALLRVANRKARRQPKIERSPRRDRLGESHEAPVRGTARTPRSLAIPGAADLPRPVPPPPARTRPRTVLGFGALLLFALGAGAHHPRSASSAPVMMNCVATAASSSPMIRVITRIPV